MKKVKIGFWVILVGFIGLVIYQNPDLFQTKKQLMVHIPFTDPVYTPELYNAFFFIAFFLAGLLISYFSNLFEQYKARKTIRGLTALANAQKEELEGLKKALEGPSAADASGSSTGPSESAASPPSAERAPTVEEPPPAAGAASEPERSVDQPAS